MERQNKRLMEMISVPHFSLIVAFAEARISGGEDVQWHDRDL